MQPFIPLFSTFLIFISIHVHTISCQDVEEYVNCSRSYNCGGRDITYPFYGAEGRPDYCGYPGFQVTCVSDVLKIIISSLSYRVLGIDNSTKTLTVARDDYWNGYCVDEFHNTSIQGSNIFSYGSTSLNLTLYYGCPLGVLGLPRSYSCTINSTNNTGHYLTPMLSQPELVAVTAFLTTCLNQVKLPVFQSNIASLDITPSLPNLIATIKSGFELEWSANNPSCDACDKSGGQCGRNVNTNEFICYCPDNSTTCTTQITLPPTDQNSDKKSSIPLIAGVVAAGATVLLCLGFLMFCIIRRNKRNAAETKTKSLPTPPSSNGLPTPSTNFSRTTPSYPSSLSTHDLDKGSMYFGVQVFTYTELEEATDNFDASRELGDGGFGVVYYGKLHDGRVVAVKRLYENNFKRVEQFINEIEILARLRHRNLVTLYGCTSRKSRGLLLVYEYIPNGTVADHLHGDKSKSGLLTWKIRLNIAVETASALYYLHKSDIIHRDVKTNNILLDNDFTVKVADFGLIRLFPTDMTHVSTAPQGTPGYVDPEYYQCYQLTDKSDVYSFGVVLVELISSLQAVDTNRHRHDINLSNLAINKIQNHTLHELVDPSLGYETDEDVRRMTTLVAELAFRCLQHDRDMRPSMEEVLTSLKLIQNENSSDTLKPEEVDIPADDAGLLKNMPPPFSPDSARSFNWANNPTTTSSF